MARQARAAVTTGSTLVGNGGSNQAANTQAGWSRNTKADTAEAGQAPGEDEVVMETPQEVVVDETTGGAEHTVDLDYHTCPVVTNEVFLPRPRST